jgi:hypothetical protein
MNTYFVTVTKDGSKKGESFSTFVKVETSHSLIEQKKSYEEELTEF